MAPVIVGQNAFIMMNICPGFGSVVRLNPRARFFSCSNVADLTGVIWHLGPTKTKSYPVPGAPDCQCVRLTGGKLMLYWWIVVVIATSSIFDTRYNLTYLH